MSGYTLIMVMRLLFGGLDSYLLFLFHRVAARPLVSGRELARDIFAAVVKETIVSGVVLIGGKEAILIILNWSLLRLDPELLQDSLLAAGCANGCGLIFAEYIICSLFLIFILRYAKQRMLNRRWDAGNWQWCMPAAIILILCCFLGLDIVPRREQQFLLIAGALLFCLSGMLLWVSLSVNSYFVHKLVPMEAELAGIRDFIHDSHSFNRHIRRLALNRETDKIVELVDELEGRLEEQKVVGFESSHVVLNAILTEWKGFCEGRGIRFTILTEPGVDVGFIQISDMLSLFGNILDNAAEAAEQCPPGKRQIDVKLFMATAFILVFYVENSFVTIAEKKGNRYLSTKKENDLHGRGLTIVAGLAEKYGGGLELTEKNGMFISILTLSVISKS